MKSILLSLLSILITGATLSAQVYEKDLRMSEGVHNALTLELKGADKKKAEKIWKDFAKQFGKVERDRKLDEYFILGAIVPSIDPEYAVNIYTKFDEFDNMTRANFWFKMDERFLNSIDDEKEINGADAFLSDYGVAVEKEVVKDELEDQEKELKNLQKDLEKLEKENRNYYKDIEKAKETIRKAEEALRQNEKDQEAKKEEIKEQKEVVKSVSDKMNKVGKTR